MTIDILKLPDAVRLEVKKGDLVEMVETLIAQKRESEKLEVVADKPMSVEELCQYINIAKQTIYGWTSKNLIPHYKTPDGRKLYFIKSEIDTWLTSNRRKTQADIALEAATHIQRQKEKRAKK